MRLIRHFFFLIGWVSAFVLGGAGAAFSARDIPKPTAPVLDEAHLLSASEERTLNELLKAAVNDIQIQIWITPSLEGESIESLSIRAAERWRLGSAERDQGALILVALQDRQLRIEVGQGLEGEIPDAVAFQLIEKVMKPEFREGRFFRGLEQAAVQLIARARGQQPAMMAERSSSRSTPSLLFIFLMIVVVGLRLIGGGLRRRGIYRSHGWSPPLGGWSGGGGFGGGGWSGGGGGFSGGGASGRW